MKPRRKKSVALTQVDPYRVPKKSAAKPKKGSASKSDFVLSWKFWAIVLCVFAALILLSHALRN
jgi:hypothetical protein